MPQTTLHAAYVFPGVGTLEPEHEKAMGSAPTKLIGDARTTAMPVKTIYT